MSTENKNLTASVQEYLDSQHWKYFQNKDLSAFQMLMELKNPEIGSCEIRIFVHEEIFFTTLVLLPFKISSKKRALAAEFIARVNFHLQLGGFEMDYDTGEFEYKTTCFCGNITLDRDYIQHHILLGVRMLDLYGESLINILFRDAPIEEEIKKAEQKFTSN